MEGQADATGFAENAARLPDLLPSCSFWRMADSDAIWRALDEQRRDLKLPDLSISREQFRRAIEPLPANHEWAISEDATTVWALSALTLFKVRVEGNSAPVTSRAVDPSALTVDVSSTEDAEPPTRIDKEGRDAGMEENWRESHWTFGHRDGEEYLQITGRTKAKRGTTAGGREPDRRELFARALASRAADS